MYTGRIFFVGFSLGGALAQISALRAALEHPSLASAIHVLALGAVQWASPPLAQIYEHTFGDRAAQMATVIEDKVATLNEEKARPQYEGHQGQDPAQEVVPASAANQPSAPFSRRRPWQLQLTSSLASSATSVTKPVTQPVTRAASTLLCITNQGASAALPIAISSTPTPPPHTHTDGEQHNRDEEGTTSSGGVGSDGDGGHAQSLPPAPPHPAPHPPGYHRALLDPMTLASNANTRQLHNLFLYELGNTSPIDILSHTPYPCRCPSRQQHLHPQGELRIPHVPLNSPVALGGEGSSSSSSSFSLALSADGTLPDDRPSSVELLLSGLLVRGESSSLQRTPSVERALKMAAFDSTTLEVTAFDLEATTLDTSTVNQAAVSAAHRAVTSSVAGGSCHLEGATTLDASTLEQPQLEPPARLISYAASYAQQTARVTVPPAAETTSEEMQAMRHLVQAYWKGTLAKDDSFAVDTHALHRGEAYRQALLREHWRLKGFTAALCSEELPLVLRIDGAWDYNANPEQLNLAGEPRSDESDDDDLVALGF